MTHLSRLQVLHQSKNDFPRVKDFPPEVNPEDGIIRCTQEHYRLSLSALQSMEEATPEKESIDELLFFLQQFYQKKRTLRTTATEIASLLQRDPTEVARSLAYLSDLPIFIKPAFDPKTGFLSSFALSDVVLAASPWNTQPLPKPPSSSWIIQSFSIDGYKPFLRTQFPIHPKTAFIGPSGSGKTCALAAWQFLRYAIKNALPESFDPWWKGKKIFTTGCPEAIRLGLEISFGEKNEISRLRYEVEIHGEGPPKIFRESVRLQQKEETLHLITATVGRGVYLDDTCASRALPFVTKPNETYLSHAEKIPNLWLSLLQSYLAQSECYFSLSALDEEHAILRTLQARSHLQIQALHAFLQQHIAGFETFYWKENIICKETSMRDEVLWQDTSESFRRLFYLAVLAHSDATIFILDTPFRGISPEYHPLVEQMLQMMSQRGQVIASLEQSLSGFESVRIINDTGRPLAKNL